MGHLLLTASIVRQWQEILGKARRKSSWFPPLRQKNAQGWGTRQRWQFLTFKSHDLEWISSFTGKIILNQMRNSRSRHLSENQLSWLFVGAFMCSVIYLDMHGSTQRWHSPLIWTFTSFCSTLIVRRKSWNSLLFWAAWIVLLCFHVAMMWLIFAKLLPTLFIGSLFILPIAVFESVLLFAYLPPWSKRFRKEGRRN